MVVTTPVPPALPEELTAVLHRMRLPYLRAAAPEVLATAQRWDPAETLRVLLAEEIRGRDQATRTQRRRSAGLPAGKTFASWRHTDSAVPTATQQALATLEWLGRAENLAVTGPEVINGLILGTESPGRRARCFDRCSVVSGVRAVRVLPVRGVRVLAGGRGSRRGPARARRAVPGALLGAAS